MVRAESAERYGRIANEYKDFIIIHPIMTGGLVPQEVQERLFKEGWNRFGYPLCFNCLKGRSDIISKPPVADFLSDIAEFYGGDKAEHTFGCRAAQFTVMKTISDFAESQSSTGYSKVAIVDPLCHYTTVIAAEVAGLRVVEPPHGGHPEYKVKAEGYQQRIEEVRKETGRLPGLVVVTHAEPNHGNLNPAAEVGEIAQQYNVPYMVNAAYTGGVMPVDMRDFHADFLTVSAHKSMASLGPLGFLVTRGKWSERAFRNSKIVTEGTGRAWRNKITNIFGCSVGGIPVISAMYSFEYVFRRVNTWTNELSKARWLLQEIERIGGIRLIGEHPHRHHLLHFETPIFWEISKHHKNRGFFLAEEMIKKGIVGLQRGLTKHVKLSVYGLTWDQVRKVRNALYEVAEEWTKKFNLDRSVP